MKYDYFLNIYIYIINCKILYLTRLIENKNKNQDPKKNDVIVNIINFDIN